jgi:ABC-type Fe3+-citrate transport system substrate-binding protein
MATVAFFIVTIVIIAECQSQDNNDYVSTKETVIEPTEVVETSVPKKVSV